MKLFHNKKGFNLIEVIISIIILSLIASSLSLLFSLSLDTPYIENKIKANYYAQREIERLNNMSFDSIVSVPRTNYSFDNRFDYEIKVGTQQNQRVKEVYVNFYSANSNTLLSELYTEFVKISELTEICENFQDRNDYDNNPWSWNKNPTVQWSIVEFPTNSGNYVYRYARRQQGNAYPNWVGAQNYSVSAKVYVTSAPFLYSIFYIGGRCNPNQNQNGYYIKVEIYYYDITDYTTTISLVRRTNNSDYVLDSVDLEGAYFNTWINVKLEMNGNNLKYYYKISNPTNSCDDGQNWILLGEVNDNTYTSGGINIISRPNRNGVAHYFDDIGVEIPWKKEKDFLLLRLW